MCENNVFNKTIFSERVSSLLKNTNTTQYKLAKSIGVSKNAIYDIVHARRAASIEVIYNLANFFDCSIDFIVGRTDDPKRY